MAKICPKCGVDLALKQHRPNCPERNAKSTKRADSDDQLTINPALINPMTTGEVNFTPSPPPPPPPAIDSGSGDFSGDSGAGASAGGDF